MGSRILTFSPADYVIRATKYRIFRENIEYCFNAFLPSSINGMIIGTTMFKKYYVKFEFGATPAVSTAIKV